RKGMAVTFTVPGTEETPFQGIVEELRPTPSPDQQAVFYKVLVDAANRIDPVSHEWVLRPGMTASVELLSKLRPACWKVLTAALNLAPDVAARTEAARARLSRWQQQSDHARWRPVWVLDSDRKPYPVLVRLSGDGDQEALQDGQFTEVLEWDPEWTPR